MLAIEAQLNRITARTKTYDDGMPKSPPILNGGINDH